jgi:RNA polymerase sigma-70 factor (ECF subfamily)
LVSNVKYGYVRRCGHNADDAQDLTQEFLARLLQRHDLARADPSKGRFRSFLLGAMNHFLSVEWHKTQTIKRGGQQTFCSLDAHTAEERYQYEPVSALTPEKIYERRWALTLFDRALARLQEEWQAAGKQEQFPALKSFLFCPAGKQEYAPVAANMGISAGAVATLVVQLRQRCAELIRAEIAHTVTTASELEEELRHLISLDSS